jgi:dihydroorotase/N-acyl-D-amino-acid deacylase
LEQIKTMRKSDLLLANAIVIDGSGGPSQRVDVLVTGERIAAVGNVPPGTEREILDCSNLHIAPGFIDVHSHSDKEVLQHLPNKVLQGVTSEVVGNCGYSLFPTNPNPEGIRLTGEIFDGEPEEGMATAAEYFAAVEEAGTRVNVAALTGHVALRIFAMKVRQTPSADEMRVMERQLEECLAAGSIGFSTGLNCLPSSFAGTDELIRLCQLVRNFEGFYTTHVRDYKFKVVEAVDEALAVGRGASLPVQISHLQVIGKKNWEKLDIALAHIEQAAQCGVDVAMDAYPYLAGSCSLTQFLPGWCQSGGLPRLLEHLSRPSAYQRIARETDEGMSNTWDDLVICDVHSPTNQSLIGKSIAQIASLRNKPPQEVALDLLLEEDGYVFIISFNSNDVNLRKVLTHPLTSIITDGMVLGGMSHPRTFGTYPKFLGEYVIEKGWLSLEEAIAKTSGLPASRFKLKGRGSIIPGKFADLVVFDALKIGTRADYANPAQEPEGIHHVLVNGEFAVRDGKLTEVKAGKVLRHNG